MENGKTEQARTAGANRPKHILLIISDQCRADALGAYGNTHAQTPALDAIAAESTVYRRAVTPSPVCVPARLCMMAGQYAARTGNALNNTAKKYGGEGFYSALTKDGYNSFCAGKMHYVFDSYGSLGFRARASQEEMSHPDDDYTKFISAPDSPYRNVFDYNGHRGEMYYVPQVSPLPAEVHPTQWVGDRAVEFIDGCDPDEPAFLMASFIHPHPPFCPPAPWNKLFRAPTLPPPYIPDTTSELKPLLHATFDTDRLGLSPIDILRLKNFYYACVSFMDYQIGRIVASLKEKRMYDDTLILFVSDHGECLGDYRNMGKRTMLSPAATIPFILRLPGGEHTVCDDAVSLVDIAPTLLSYAGIGYNPDEYDGIDILNGRHEYVFSQYSFGDKGVYMIASPYDKLIYSVEENRYRYFDTLPEHTDRYSAPAAAERVALLKPLLDAHIASDVCEPPVKKKDAPQKGKQPDYFGTPRMDHVRRSDEERARIPEGYVIDLTPKGVKP